MITPTGHDRRPDKDLGRTLLSVGVAFSRVRAGAAAVAAMKCPGSHKSLADANLSPNAVEKADRTKTRSPRRKVNR